MPKFTITNEALYRARIDYEHDERTSDRIVDRAFAESTDLECTSFSGCPACGPYLEVEGDTLEEVHRWSMAMAKFIRKLEAEA
jgi:hypothetical protein